MKIMGSTYRLRQHIANCWQYRVLQQKTCRNRHQNRQTSHGGLWLLRPKTVGSQRRVALPQVLADSLAEHLEAVRPARFVFESQPGVPIDPRRDHEDWKTALKEEGLPPMRLHSARHTAATLLAVDRKSVV